MTPFAVGDVVRVKGEEAATRMTVEECTGVRIRCVWFETSDRLHRGWFDANQLELAPEQE